MEWETVARVIAPTLATALGGPLGGVAASIVGDVLFPNQPDRAQLSPLAVMDKIATMNAPADIAKLRDAEQALIKFEADNKFRFAQMAAESQQNARTMRVSALASNNRTADRLAWLSLISFLVVAALVLLLVGLIVGNVIDFSGHSEVWAAVSGLIGSVLGYFSANANQVISFYFGSSAGSAAKTEQLGEKTSEFLSFLSRQPANQPLSSQPPPAVAGIVGTTDGKTAVVAAGPEPEVKDLVRSVVTAPAKPDPKADQRWNDCIDFVLRQEGGYSNDAADHGQATNHGITLSTLSHFRRSAVTDSDVQALSVDEARRIYQQAYWDVVRCDDLPQGVDLCVFDTAVLCGPGRAGQFLQVAARMDGADVDGRVGPRTLQAVHSLSPIAIVDTIAELRERFHRDCVEKDPTQQRFLQGWLVRLQAMRQLALQMVNAPEGALTS